MKSLSTVSQAQGDGSTTPHLLEARRRREAERIREQWRINDGSPLADRLPDRLALRRHKSLILDLVVEDCAQWNEQTGGQTAVLDLADRYQGLGHSLEKSIVRQLEVQQYLGENPELLEFDAKSDWPTPDERFGEFDILEELGRGAIARVYLCRQPELGERLVVVKVAFGSTRVEASLIARLQHPHIMPVHFARYDEQVGASLICMPFLGRSTLADLIDLAFRSGQLPTRGDVVHDAADLWLTEADRAYWNSDGHDGALRDNANYIDEVLRLMTGLAEGLQYAHDKGVVHGDVKPSNVLLTSAGQPMLFDFNLGREIAARDGPAGGTLPYMAPEQLQYLAAGNLEEMPAPSVASDVYSFGALLHEMLTGKPPCHVDPSANVDQASLERDVYLQQRAGFASATSRRQVVNRSLGRLLDDCLSFRPEERPPSMAAVIDRLRGQTTATARTARSVRANKLSIAAAIGVAILTVGGALVYRASLPPYEMRQYQRALLATDQGDNTRSIELLEDVLIRDPGFHLARLLRAQNYIEKNNLDGARYDLFQLAKSHDFAPAKPWIGYYFGLINEYGAAIAWYEASLDAGIRSAAILNNMGASHVLGTRSRLSDEDRRREAGRRLRQAMELDPDSTTIRLNYVRWELDEVTNSRRSSRDIDIENVRWLVRNAPQNGKVLIYCFDLMACAVESRPELTSEAVSYLRKALELGAHFQAHHLAAGAIYQPLQGSTEFQETVRAMAESGPPTGENPLTGGSRFLKPAAMPTRR